MAAGRDMSAADVVRVVTELEQAGIEFWLDGGWGVDALLGEQTRPHADLDLAIDRTQLAEAEVALKKLGFSLDSTASPGPPARFVFVDDAGRIVDLHPLAFDEAGDGWQQLSESRGEWGRYPAGDLAAKGLMEGRRVPCLSPGLQIRFHLGYEPTDRDEHDLRLLTERFGVGPPDRPQPR